MAVSTPWDIRIVNATNLAVITHIPRWEMCEFGDTLNTPGHGRVEVDYDDPWLADFYSTNSNTYPWEGNYAIQVVRDGTLVFTFFVEEAEIEYAGLNRRRIVLGGRGIAAALEWALVLPGGFDEALADPDGDDNIVMGGMSRGFGKAYDDTPAGLAELDAGTYSNDNPKYRGYGAAAFVHLFEEADTGDAQTADIASAYAIAGSSRDGDSVDWPLSLSTHLSVTTDSNQVTWATNATYPVTGTNDICTNLFEVPAGTDLFKALEDLTAKTANAQWKVDPDGKIYIADSLGTNYGSTASGGTGTILLTVTNAVESRQRLHRVDLRTRMYASNKYLFEAATDATADGIYGRREGFISTQQAHGEFVGDVAKQSLEEVKTMLDNYTFKYIETSTTRAWLDFVVGDVVRIEYEPGVSADRQITGLSANLSAGDETIEIAIGDVIKNMVARLDQEETTEAYTWQISQGDSDSSGKPTPPTNVSAGTDVDGLDRTATVEFKQPKGWENEIAMYEAEVWKV